MGVFKIFEKKKDDPFCSILKRLNVHYRFAQKIERAFIFFGGVVYSPENLVSIRAAINSRQLNQFFEENSYDMTGDNIEVFWIEDGFQQARLLLVFDPFELFASEVLLEQIPSSTEFLDEIREKKEIELS